MPDAPPENATSQAAEAPQEGDGLVSTSPPEGEQVSKVFDEAYVKELRDESAKHRREKKALVERLLDGTIASTATDMADPADLLVYVDRADLMGEDGLPDAELILAAQTDLLERKPHLRSRKARGDIDQGGRGQEVETFSFNDWLRAASG